MSALHPIPVGWASAGETGARNYDEFVDEAEITAVIDASPDSMLAVEMPHRAPGAVAAGLDFRAALPGAVERLHRLEESGRLVPFADAVGVYRIGAHFLGLFCLVDTGEIGSGRVVRNEEVFKGKVVERTELIRALGTATSPVLLIQSAGGDTLRDVLAELAQGPPAATDVDAEGRTHEVWLVGAGETRDRLLAAADVGELVVADGNHRSLAAQEAGLSRFLAVVVPPDAVTIEPYQRLVRRLDQPIAAVLEKLVAAGCTVGPGAVATPPRGTVVLYADGCAHAVNLPAPRGTTAEKLDHSVVEWLLFGDVLGIAPDDPVIAYVGGHSTEWLTGEVDAGHAALAVLLAPVRVEDFVAVNLERAMMPRKSTWFIPKARTGLVLADVSADLVPPEEG